MKSLKRVTFTRDPAPSSPRPLRSILKRSNDSLDFRTL